MGGAAVQRLQDAAHVILGGACAGSPLTSGKGTCGVPPRSILGELRGGSSLECLSLCMTDDRNGSLGIKQGLIFRPT